MSNVAKRYAAALSALIFMFSNTLTAEVSIKNKGASGDEDILVTLVDKSVKNVWNLEVSGGNIQISEEMAKALSLKEGGELFFIVHGGRTFMFAARSKMRSFEKKLNSKEIKIAADQIRAVKIKRGLLIYADDIGDTGEDFDSGAVVIEYNDNLSEIIGGEREDEYSLSSAYSFYTRELEKAVNSGGAAGAFARELAIDGVKYAYKVEPSSDGTSLKISPEMAKTYDIKEGDTIYAVKSGGKILLYKDGEQLEKIKAEYAKSGTESENIKSAVVGKDLSIPVSILDSLSSKKGGFKQGAVALNGGESLPAQFIEATTETNDAAVRAAFSFASDNEAIRAISKENISSVYKLGVDGDSNNIKISPEMARALSIREGDSIYVVSHGGKTLLFNSAEKFKNFSDALKAGGIEILPEDVKIVKVQSGLKLPIKEMSKTGSSFKSGAIAVDHFGITELIETPSSVSGAKILKSALLEISEDPVSEKQFSSSLTFVPESVSDDKAQAAYILSTDEQNLKISREMGGAISILEGDQIYVVNYGGQTYLFTDRSKLQNFEYELRNQGAAPYDYSVDAVRVQKGMTISLNDLTPGDKGQALAKFRGGAIALEYDGVTRLIGASFEEDAYASAASKEAPLQSLAQGKVLGVWKLKTEFGNIKISPEMAKGLAVKEGGNLYFITYGARTFLFADKAKMLEFENKLKKSGAAVEASDINVAAIEPGWEFPVKAIGRADADFSHGAVVVQHNANIAEILEDADTTLKPSMYEGTRIAGRPKDKDGGRIDSISAKTKDKDAYKKIQAGSTDKYGYYYKGKDAADAEAGGKSTYFGFDKSYVTPEGKDLIEALAERLKGKKYNITVQGHTDSIGTREYNQKLSERRAEAVRRELISKGLDATKIDIAGFGEDKPIADNNTPQGRAKNRRAVIFVEIE